MQKTLTIIVLAAAAAVLVGGSFGMSALAATVHTYDNVQKAVVSNGQETVILNLNSIPGAKGDKGDQGIPGVPGRDGADGKPGLNGTNGRDGISTICIVSANQTCGLPLGNTTHASLAPATTFTTKNFVCNSLGGLPFNCQKK